MMANLKTYKPLWMIVLVVLVLALKFFGPDQGRQRDPGKARPAPTGSGWTRFDNCQLVANRGNDGDSFTVLLPDGSTREFRLYFVDAPETAVKTYRGGDTNRQRVSEQARYFGMEDLDEATAVGREAARFTGGLLGGAPFTLHTRFESVFGSERLYAHVVVPERGKDAWLDEWLVRRGLARIHTKSADLPDGTPAEARRKHLLQLEKTARREQAGGWK